jgi:hypothetical protein
MKRTHIAFLLGLVALVLALALPGIARADGYTDGWTWDESAAPSSEGAPAPADPAPDGWTWDAEVAPAPEPDGWTWDAASTGAAG